MSKFNPITPFVKSARPNRSSQRNILPAAVKSRNVGSIIYSSEEASASVSLENDQDTTIELVVTQGEGYEVLALPYISLYLGSVSVANQLPSGSSVDESQWQIIGPLFDLQEWSEVDYAKHKELVNIFFRNISAGTTTVQYRARVKYISPQEGL